EDILEKRFPRDYMSSCILDGQESNGTVLQEAVQKHADRTGVKVTEGFGYKQLWMAGFQEANGTFTLSDGEQADASKLYVFAFLTQDDYRKNTGEKLDLAKGEAAVYEKNKNQVSETLTLDQLSWNVRTTVDDPGIWNEALYLSDANFMAVILPDLKSMETVLNAYNERY